MDFITMSFFYGKNKKYSSKKFGEEDNDETPDEHLINNSVNNNNKEEFAGRTKTVTFAPTSPTYKKRKASSDDGSTLRKKRAKIIKKSNKLKKEVDPRESEKDRKPIVDKNGSDMLNLKEDGNVANDDTEETPVKENKKFFKNSSKVKDLNKFSYYRGYRMSAKGKCGQKVGLEFFKKVLHMHQPLSETQVGDGKTDDKNDDGNNISEEIQGGSDNEGRDDKDMRNDWPEDNANDKTNENDATDSYNNVIGINSGKDTAGGEGDDSGVKGCYHGNKDTESLASPSSKLKNFTQLKLKPDSTIPKPNNATSLQRKRKKRAMGLPTFKGRDRSQQMILDFGQKMKGPLECEVCGLTYNKFEKADELIHSKYHKNFLATLKFNISSKDRIIQSFLDGGVIVMVLETDKIAATKVEEIKKHVDMELGFVVERKSTGPFKTFLYVMENQVIGFCLVQAIEQGFRMVSNYANHKESNDENYSSAELLQPHTNPYEVKVQSLPYCCSTTPEPVKCGANRIWVARGDRRKGIATRLLDTVRGHFSLGFPLGKTDIAFSDPTPDGIALATKYTGSPNFLVYKN